MLRKTVYYPDGTGTNVDNVTDSCFLLATGNQINTELYNIMNETYCYVIQFYYADQNQRTQLAIGYTQAHMAVRSLYNKTWSSWAKVYTSGNKPTLSELGAASSGDISNLNTRISQLEKDVKRNEPVNQNLIYNGGTSDFHQGASGTATTLSAPANAKLLKIYCNITAYCKDKKTDPVYSSVWVQGKTLQYTSGSSTSYNIAQSDALRMSVSIDTSLNITLTWTMVGQQTGCILVCDCLCTYTF